MLRGLCVEALLGAVIFALSASGASRSVADPIPPMLLAQTDQTQPSGPRTLLPLRLNPEGSDPATDQQLPDDGADAAAAETPLAAPEQPASPAIEIGELGTVDPDSGGMLEESMGGLGIEMWSGTPRSTIVRLVPQLPARHASPALHDLARRLLLSTAVVPPRGPEDTGASVMGLRVERLEAMGLVGAVVDMIALAPNRDSDPYLLRAAIDNRLLLGDVAGACAAVADAREVLPRLYWEQVTVFCQAVSGDAAGAAFGAKLLAEGGELEDPAFSTLAEALAGGGKAKIGSLTRPTPLHLAMARAAKVSLPSDVLETESPLILRALADSPVVSPAVQLEAAERAALAGAIGPHRLAERYAALEFGPDELAKAISRADGERTAVERGLLYQASRLHEVPVARAAAVQKALQVGAADDMYLLTARVYQPLLEAFDPGADLSWFGIEAARALYVLNRPDLAALWVETVHRFEEDGEQLQTADLLWPLARLSSEAPGRREAGHDRWIAALRHTAGPEWNQRAGLAYSLLESFGEPVSDENWAALMAAASRPNALTADPAYLRAFRLAAADDRRGETALLAILLLGSSGVEYAGPDLLSQIIEGLTAVGLASDARRLAVEAALAGGL